MVYAHKFNVLTIAPESCRVKCAGCSAAISTVRVDPSGLPLRKRDDAAGCPQVRDSVIPVPGFPVGLTEKYLAIFGSWPTGKRDIK